MAAPIYTTDLITLSEADDVANWDESSDAGWDDAGAMVDETNFYIQEEATTKKCVSAQFTKDGVGTIIYGHGSSVAIPTDGAVLLWHFWASPPSLSTKALGGIRTIVGNGMGAFKAWKSSGSDFEPAPLGGWYNFAIDPSLAADYTVGTVASPYSHFGMAVAATAQARGNPNAVDVIRYGRCDARYNGGEAANYATFLGFAALDNAVTARWALLMDIPGGYRWQGLMTLGYTSAVDFRDSNRNIVIGNTINVSANFNKIEIRQATSNVEWTNIFITALGTVAKGRFEMIDNATVVLIGCVFTDMDTFIFLSNGDLSTTTFRRCGQVTQGGATFDACVFEEITAAISLVVDTIAEVTDCLFTSDGSNHAVDLGTVSANATITWSNYLSGYASSDGSTGNEAIKVSVDSGVTLTINVADGYTRPYVYNTGLGTVNVVVGQRTLKLTGLADNSEVTIVRASDTTQLHNTNDTGTDGEDEYIYTYSSDTEVYINILHNSYEPITIEGIFLIDSNQSLPVAQILDRNYSNPT